MKRQEEALTSIELLVFICNVALAFVVAKFGFREFGWIGAIFGFIAGFLILPAIFYIIINIIRKK